MINRKTSIIVTLPTVPFLFFQLHRYIRCYGAAYHQGNISQNGLQIYSIWHLVIYRKVLKTVSGMIRSRSQLHIVFGQREHPSMTVWPTRMIMGPRRPSVPEPVISREVLVCGLYPLNNFVNCELWVEGALFLALDMTVSSEGTGQHQSSSLNSESLGCSPVFSGKVLTQRSASVSGRRSNAHYKHSCPPGFPTLPRTMHPYLDAANDYITPKSVHRSFERRISNIPACRYLPNESQELYSVRMQSTYATVSHVAFQ